MRFVLVTLIATLPALPPSRPVARARGHRFRSFRFLDLCKPDLLAVLTFGTLYALMSRVALPRIGSVLEERRETIEAPSVRQRRAEGSRGAGRRTRSVACEGPRECAGHRREERATKRQGDRGAARLGREGPRGQARGG